MSVLLAPDTVDVYGADAAEDGHGWVRSTATAVLLWSGPGNLQLDPPAASPTATDDGGAGPFAPRHVEAGNLYVALDCPVVPGSVVLVRGREWVAESVQTVVDPLLDGLDCAVVRVVERVEVDPDA